MSKYLYYKIYLVTAFVLISFVTISCEHSNDQKNEGVCPRFNFNNALNVSIELSEQQTFTVSGKQIQDIHFKTTFNITSFKKRSKGMYVEIMYVDSEVKSGLPVNVNSFQVLKEASEDLIGRCLSYELDENNRVIQVIGLKELLESPAGKAFGESLDQSIFKRSLKKFLLSRDDVNQPLEIGDAWKWIESTSIDKDIILNVTHDVHLDRFDKDNAWFKVAMKPVEMVSKTQSNVTVEGEGNGDIHWDRNLQLPRLISLSSSIKLLPEGTDSKVIKIDHKSTTRIINRVPNPAKNVSRPTDINNDKSIGNLLNTDRLKQILGDGWKQHPTTIINSDKDLKKYQGAARKVMESTYKSVQKNGVTSMADFSYTRKGFPLDNITIRLFRFSSLEKADAFRRKKYENEKVKSLYKKDQRDSMIIYDSLQVNKRIIFNDTDWVTCGQLIDDDLYKRILQECILPGLVR